MGLSGPIKERALASLRARHALCVDCRFAEMYAAEVPAICWDPDANGYRLVHDACQSACDAAVLRGDDDLTLHCFDLHKFPKAA